MKSLFSIGRIAILVILSCSAFAQASDSTEVVATFANELNKIFNTEVYMDVDTTVFNAKQNNFYFAEADNAMIMTMVAPQSFNKAEEHFNKQNKKDGYKTLEKKKFTHNGKNILYQKGVIKSEGKKAFMYLYAIEQSEKSTIFFTGMHMAGDEKKFVPVIERAALSARLMK